MLKIFIILRLKDEPKICALIDTLQIYLEEKGTSQEICRIYLKKIENLYYKVIDVIFLTKWLFSKIIILI